MIAYVEYVAVLLCLTAFGDGPRVESPEDWTPIKEDVQSLFMHAMLVDILAAHADGVEMDDLHSRVAGHELMVRNAAYRTHYDVVLRGLFQPVADRLLQVAGFTVDNAIAVADAVVQHEQNALNAAARLSFEAAEQTLLEPSLHYAKTGEWTLDGYRPPQGYLDHIAGGSHRDVRSALRAMASAGATRYYIDAQIFSVEDIAAASGVPLDRTRAFFNLTSISPGDIIFEPDADPGRFLLPASVHPLMTRPYVRLSGDYLVAPSAGGVIPNLQRILEGALKPNAKAWNRYQAHRHDFTLSTGVALLLQIMPDATAERELDYTFHDPDVGKRVDGELDALIEYDTALFLVEAKGHTLDDPSRRGAPDRLRKRLGEILTGSHAQALRARRFLDTADAVAFARKDDSEVHVRSRDRRIYLISLTLEPVGHITGLPEAASHPDLFASSDIPWTVCLYDLMVIADLLTLPPALPHYVERRLRAAQMGILSAPDELDFFGHYLHNGLYYDDSDLVHDGQRVDFVAVGSFTVSMDDYYLHQEGARTVRARKPSLTIDGHTRRLVEDIDASGLPGRLDAALAILDGGADFRASIKREMGIAEKRARRKGKALRLAFGQTDERGRGMVGFVIGLPPGASDVEVRIQRLLEKDLSARRADYGSLVAYERGRRRPVAVATVRPRLPAP